MGKGKATASFQRTTPFCWNRYEWECGDGDGQILVGFVRETDDTQEMTEQFQFGFCPLSAVSVDGSIPCVCSNEI